MEEKSSVILCTISVLVVIASHHLCQAHTTTMEQSAGLGSPEASLIGGKQEAGRQKARMSCFTCSTMDYESSTDNICRLLLQQNEEDNGELHRLAAMYRQIASPLTLSESDLFPNKRLSYPKLRPSQAGATEDYSPLGLARSGARRTRLVGANSSAPSDQEEAPTSMAPPSRRPVVQNNRSLVANNSIRIRPCLEDENFCSIISVVKLEFVQDNLYSKFWALERNCSKSCNTGCMLIGERVRLRVCSQCCRSANCNIGSGASSTRATRPLFHGMLAAACTLLALATLTPPLTCAQSTSFHRSWRHSTDGRFHGLGGLARAAGVGRAAQNGPTGGGALPPWSWTRLRATVN